ncbi:MAG: hypothetical protein HY303_05825, partial [Candidatus Wallbacteria bacterium]|nr:hypothetical protein [Candidatus Wallbacteria bacterium]
MAERTAPTIAGLLHLLEGAVESVVRWSLRPKKGHLMPVGVTSLARSVVAGSRSLAHPGSFNATVRRAGEILAHRDAMLDTVAGNAGLMQVGTVCFAWAYAALVGFDLLAVLRGGTSGPSLVGYLLTAIVVSLPASLLRRVALNASFKRAIADPRADGAAQVSAELAG